MSGQCIHANRHETPTATDLRRFVCDDCSAILWREPKRHLAGCVLEPDHVAGCVRQQWAASDPDAPWNRPEPEEIP